MGFIVAANWKMNKSPGETERFFSDFLKNRLPESMDIVFFIPSVNASVTAQALKVGVREKNLSVFWGPQNIYHQARGAFTGETSPQIMGDLGADFVLVGHSERRILFHEDDRQINLKMQAAIDFEMVPVLCVGESSDERRTKHTMEVLRGQMERGLINIKPKKGLHIAYEPVWAIGTGEVASPGQVEEVHGFIRGFLKNRFGSDHEGMKILYGGSVKADKALSLGRISEVGGFLVGGASLEPESFLGIIRMVE